MTKTEELLKLAEAVIEGDASIGTYYDACDPSTIKQLVELCRLQHEALRISPMSVSPVYATVRSAALNAYEEFEKS